MLFPPPEPEYCLYVNPGKLLFPASGSACPTHKEETVNLREYTGGYEMPRLESSILFSIEAFIVTIEIDMVRYYLMREYNAHISLWGGGSNLV